MKRLVGNPKVTWRRIQLLLIPRERALRVRMGLEFKRFAVAAANTLSSGGDPQDALQQHRTRTRQLLTASYSEGMPLFGKMILDAAGKAKPKKPASAFERLVQEYISEVGAEKVSQITRTSQEQLRNIIERGREDGLGNSGIASLIRDDFGDTIARWRAESIARTETHGAANAAQLFAAESLGREEMKREWIAAGDERTREDHSAADGQVVGLQEPFTVGGASLMYPGDPYGEPEQIINCRCATGFILPD